MFSKFSKKELVVAGCSIVANYVRYRNDLHKENKFYMHPMKNSHEYQTIEWKDLLPFPTLDTYIATYFKLNPVNLGLPGAGNKQIFDNIVEYIFKNHKKIKLLIVCWSNINRYDIKVNNWNAERRNYKTCFYETYSTGIHKEYVFNKSQILQNLYKLGAIDFDIDLESMLRQSCLIFSLCENFDIECVQCCSMISNALQENVINFINNSYISHIDTYHFYGWPIIPSIGGTNLFLSNQDNIISDTDRHPNELGHKQMAETLIKFIEERHILA